MSCDKARSVSVCPSSFPLLSELSRGHSDLFVTCSTNDIRVWYTPERLERLRITVPNVTRHAVEVTRDGMVIVSGNGQSRAVVAQLNKHQYVKTKRRLNWESV